METDWAKYLPFVCIAVVVSLCCFDLMTKSKNNAQTKLPRLLDVEFYFAFLFAFTFICRTTEGEANADEATVPLDAFEEMLTVISNSSLVPEVEVKHGDVKVLAVLQKHNVTVFWRYSGEEDLQVDNQQKLTRLRRQLRSSVQSDLHLLDSHEEVAVAVAKDAQRKQQQQQNRRPWRRQGSQGNQLGKLFPQLMGFRAPQSAQASPSSSSASVAWEEQRRVNARRNLLKLLDNLTNGGSVGAGGAAAAQTTTRQIQTSSSSSSSNGNSNQKKVINLQEKVLVGQKQKTTREQELEAVAVTPGGAGAKTSQRGAAVDEERIFTNSDNPRFPKKDVTFSLIDHRGDVNARDYDYVEFHSSRSGANVGGGNSRATIHPRPLQKDSTTFAGDVSTEEEDAMMKRFQGKPASAAARDADLKRRWEMNSERRRQPSYRFPQPLHHHHNHQSSQRQNGDDLGYYVQASASQEEQGLHLNPFSALAFRRDDSPASTANANLRNDTKESFALYPEQLLRRMNSRRVRDHPRVRRDIFGHGSPIMISEVQSIFQDIKDNYPKMLERLSDSVHLPDLPSIADNGHITNLLDVAPHGGLDSLLPIRRTRSTAGLGFDRNDPLLNEIGYQLPTLPPPPSVSVMEKTSLSSIVSSFWQRWHLIQEELKKFFTKQG